MEKMKILNLYAGLGGNRKLWPSNCEIISVEKDYKIAKAYQHNFPEDTVVISDAHEFLLNNYKDFDFIWASPPCQSHSKMIRSGRNRKARYADMKLYEEILFLKHNFKGLWVVENVIPFYEPLIEYQKIGRHVFWSNFEIPKIEEPKFKNFMTRQNASDKQALMDWLGIHYDGNIYYEGNHCVTQVLRNCVHPLIGKAVFEAASSISSKTRE